MAFVSLLFFFAASKDKKEEHTPSVTHSPEQSMAFSSTPSPSFNESVVFSPSSQVNTSITSFYTSQIEANSSSATYSPDHSETSSFTITSSNKAETEPTPLTTEEIKPTSSDTPKPIVPKETPIIAKTKKSTPKLESTPKEKKATTKSVIEDGDDSSMNVQLVILLVIVVAGAIYGARTKFLSKSRILNPEEAMPFKFSMNVDQDNDLSKHGFTPI